MFIATKYLETKFNKIYKKGEVVTEEVAKAYPRYVEEVKGELLTEDPKEVHVIKDVQDDELKKEEEDVKKAKTVLKKEEEDVKKLKAKRNKK